MINILNKIYRLVLDYKNKCVTIHNQNRAVNDAFKMYRKGKMNVVDYLKVLVDNDVPIVK